MCWQMHFHVYQGLIHLRLSRDIMPLQDPTSVMDEFHDTTHSLLNLPSTDDNPLSYVWLKDTQDEDPKLSKLCSDPSSGFHKKNFAGKELVCFTEKR